MYSHKISGVAKNLVKGVLMLDGQLAGHRGWVRDTPPSCLRRKLLDFLILQLVYLINFKCNSYLLVIIIETYYNYAIFNLEECLQVVYALGGV